MANIFDSLASYGNQQPVNNGWAQIFSGLEGIASQETPPALQHLSKLASARPDIYGAQYANALAQFGDPDRNLNAQYKQAQIQALQNPKISFSDQIQLMKLQQEQQGRNNNLRLLGGGFNNSQIQQTPNLPALASVADPNAPLNQKNNNPGNLKDPTTGQFRQFSSANDGIAANLADFQGKIMGDSPAMKAKFGDNYAPNLKNIISVWAPAGDNNDPTAYANYVSKKTGIPVDQPLQLEDAARILPAMAQMEGGSNYNPSALASLTNSTSSAQNTQSITNADVLPNQEPESLSMLRQFAQQDPSDTNVLKYLDAKRDFEKEQKKTQDSVITPQNSNLIGDDFINSLDNQDVRNKAKALLDGRIPYPSINSRTPTNIKMAVEAAQQADPTFSAQTYPIRAATQKAFTSGQEAKNVNALNTALNHLNELKDAAKDLNNSGNKTVNYVANAIGGQDDAFNAKLTRYNTAKQAVASETAKVYKGAGALSQEEQSHWQSLLSPNLGPQAQQAAIEETAKLLTGKIDALKEQYQTVFPQANKEFLSKNAQKTLSNLGLSEDVNQTPNAPNLAALSSGNSVNVGGKVYNFPTPQAADAFKKAAGL